MFRIVIVILIYHRHKLIHVFYYDFFWTNLDYTVVHTYCPSATALDLYSWSIRFIISPKLLIKAVSHSIFLCPFWWIRMWFQNILCNFLLPGPYEVMTLPSNLNPFVLMLSPSWESWSDSSTCSYTSIFNQCEASSVMREWIIFDKTLS
jgi:hypothetical protein